MSGRRIHIGLPSSSDGRAEGDRTGTPASESSTATVLVDADGLSTVLGVSRSWVYRAAAAGRIPCLRVGRGVRFKLARVLEALQSDRRVGAPDVAVRAPTPLRARRAPHRPSTHPARSTPSALVPATEDAHLDRIAAVLSTTEALLK
jgi:excisionase family DNA binding protein